MPRGSIGRRRRPARHRSGSAPLRCEHWWRSTTPNSTVRGRAGGAVSARDAAGQARGDRSQCAPTIDRGGLHRTQPRGAERGADCAWPSRLPVSVGRVRRPGRSGMSTRPIVGGDATSAAIAAASHPRQGQRDRFMVRCADELHPRVGVLRARGVLHAEHRAAIAEAWRLAAAPDVVRVDGVPAAHALRSPSERGLQRCSRR